MGSVREWDEQSYRSERGSRPVTVRRYKISDVDEHDDRWETSSRVSRREPDSNARSRSRVTTREFRYERDVSSSPPPDVRQIRIERDISRDPPRRRDHDDYDLDRYTRSTEYFERERPERDRHREAQTIIIKNEAPAPIIIRERENVEGREIARREESVHEEEKKEDALEVQSTHTTRSASVDNRQVARRDDSEEDYYYQRTTREVARRQPRDEYDDYRQARHRPRDDNYSDDEVYYRRTEYTDPDEHTLRDPNHRRHLAEGAIVGLGAAALANHNRKKKGEKSGGAGQLIGGAVVGAAGTELYSRANRYFHERESSRDREYSDRGRRHGSPGRSRERSHSRGHELAKYGALAAIGAVAGYAISRAGKDKKDERRSRSRRRRHSRGRHSRSRSSSSGGKQGASKRNSTIAGAGLASAAVAGLVEHHRSKSRPGRSRSRIRTGLPIAAAGLGGAALAGLYEKNKAKRKESRARSKTRSLSRSRSRSVAPDEHSRGGLAGDDHLIEYGEGSIPPPEHGRPRSRADSDVSGYGRRRGSPSSAESSPRRHRHGGSGDHHYGADAGAAVGGAGIAGVAAHEASQRRERKRAERERRRQEEDRNDTPQGQPAAQQAYGFGPYAQEPPPPPPMGPPQGQNSFPQNNNYGAPPNFYSPVPNFTGQTAYGAQEYAQPQPQYAPQQQQQQQQPQQQGPPGGNYDSSNVHFQPPPGQQ